MATDGF